MTKAKGALCTGPRLPLHRYGRPARCAGEWPDADRSLYRSFVTSSMLPIVAAALTIGIFLVDTITRSISRSRCCMSSSCLMAGAYFQRRGVLVVSPDAWR